MNPQNDGTVLDSGHGFLIFCSLISRWYLVLVLYKCYIVYILPSLGIHLMKLNGQLILWPSSEERRSPVDQKNLL